MQRFFNLHCQYIKMVRIFIAIFLLLIIIGCKRSVDPVAVCMQSKVYEFKFQQTCPSGAAVKEYIFQNATVYVFVDGNCIADGGASVWDANCNYLGYLGGLIANSKINGIDFYANAQYKRMLWHN